MSKNFSRLDIMARTFQVADTISYQPNAVVSSTLINKPSGTVTVFAFDAEQGLSEHTAPFDAAVYLVDGEAEVTISGHKHHLKSGEMIIMPANEPHAIHGVTQFKMMLIMIKDHK